MPRNAGLLKHAHAMRRDPTEPEKRLWRALSNSQLGGHKFRRQAVVGGRIADFLCPAKALIVEVDGDTHEAERDQRRDADLAVLGFRTLHFANADVIANIEGVVSAIMTALSACPDRWPHPNPSPEGEGLGAMTRPPTPSLEREGEG